MITFRRLGHFGRFGNQLFQYAGTRLYAELNGFDWAFPSWIGNQLFSLPQKPVRRRHTLLPTVQLQDVKCTSWSERLLRPVGLWRRGSVEALWAYPRDNINLYGYLQDKISLDVLREHRDIVRSWFRFRPEIDTVFRQATKQYRPWVAMHVRRGDLIKRNLVVPIERYIQLLPAILGDKNLFITSDDKNIQKDFAGFPSLNIQNPLPELCAYTPRDVFDFWMMKEATTLLAGGSTLSWWAAYLGTSDYYAPPLTHLWPKGYVPILEHQDL